MKDKIFVAILKRNGIEPIVVLFDNEKALRDYGFIFGKITNLSTEFVEGYEVKNIYSNADDAINDTFAYLQKGKDKDDRN